MAILKMQKGFYPLLFTFIITVLGSCSIDKEKSVDRSRFNFKTGDDTKLFFKNIRQSDYELEENEAARFQIFRHDDRPDSDSVPYLNPAIVISILRDEAYILLEPSAVLADEERIEVVLKDETSTDTLSYEMMNRENNLEFASRIYENLQQGGTFLVKDNGSLVPCMTDQEVRESFRITMSDYYRLTRIY